MVSYERLSKILYSYDGTTISWPVGVSRSNTILKATNSELRKQLVNSVIFNDGKEKDSLNKRTIAINSTNICKLGHPYLKKKMES